MRSPSYRLRYVAKWGNASSCRSETSRSNDQTEEKTKGEDAEDGEITGSTEKTDDTEEPKTSGTGKTVPEIWNREWPSNVDLPSSYDYREHERAPKIGNQGFLGTCWAFASLTALESTLLPKQKETFSVDHMSMHNHFLLGQDEGGEYTMSMAYLLSWEGPVWESEDPYGDGFSPDGLKAREHVQEIQILPSKDYEAIKKAVYLEGGVQSSFIRPCGIMKASLFITIVIPIPIVISVRKSPTMIL